MERRNKRGAPPEGDGASHKEQLGRTLDLEARPTTATAQAAEHPSTLIDRIHADLAAEVALIDAEMTELTRRRIDVAVAALIRLAACEADALYIEAARHPAGDTRAVDGIALSERQDAVLAALAARALGEPFRLAGGGEDVPLLIRTAFAERVAVLARAPYPGGLA